MERNGVDRDLFNYLGEIISDHKRERFNEVLNKRTNHITVVLEDIFQAHNASAVLRSCDCFGIQNVHMIENRNNYEISRHVDMGASKWLTISRYSEQENNTLDAINKLKAQGYKIIATTPHEDDTMIGEMPLDQKTALLFGTEKDGLSQVALDNADGFVRVPMHGFSESYNISVCAALSLFAITERLHQSDIPWQLTDDEKEVIFMEWMKRSINSSDLIIEDYYQKENAKSLHIG